MATRQKRHEAADRRQDIAGEDSFPASDPPAHSGIVGPQGPHVHAASRPPSHQRDEDARPKGTPTDERHATETAHAWENERPSRR